MVFLCGSEMTNNVTFFLYKMIINQRISTFRGSESINPSRKLRLDHFVIDSQLMVTVGNPKHAFEFTEFRFLRVKNPALGFVLAITERRLSKQENLDSLFPWRFIRSFQWW